MLGIVPPNVTVWSSLQITEYLFGQSKVCVCVFGNVQRCLCNRQIMHVRGRETRRAKPDRHLEWVHVNTCAHMHQHLPCGTDLRSGDVTQTQQCLYEYEMYRCNIHKMNRRRETALVLIWPIVHHHNNYNTSDLHTHYGMSTIVLFDVTNHTQWNSAPWPWYQIIIFLWCFSQCLIVCWQAKGNLLCNEVANFLCHHDSIRGNMGAFVHTTLNWVSTNTRWGGGNPILHRREDW